MLLDRRSRRPRSKGGVEMRLTKGGDATCPVLFMERIVVACSATRRKGECNLARHDQPAGSLTSPSPWAASGRDAAGLYSVWRWRVGSIPLASGLARRKWVAGRPRVSVRFRPATRQTCRHGKLVADPGCRRARTDAEATPETDNHGKTPDPCRIQISRRRRTVPSRGRCSIELRLKHCRACESRGCSRPAANILPLPQPSRAPARLHSARLGH